MTKRLIAEEMVRSGAAETQREAETAVDGVFEAVRAVTDRGETVQIRGFGSFAVKERAGRLGRNPRTGESINIAATRKLTFKLPRGGS